MNLISIIKSIIWEVLIICSLILVYNNYIGNSDTTIKADGIGYYDYLPSIFIHGDLIRKDIKYSNNPDYYDRTNNLGVYIDYKEYTVNKYPCGTAILISPFFTFNYISSSLRDFKVDGYEHSFQKTVFYAAIFYLLLSIIFLKKLLRLYKVRQLIIILSQFLMVMATSVTIYANMDSSFSHVYSLFAICVFIFFVKSYFINNNLNHFIWACVFLGLIIILRQINILVILFVPFLAGSTENLKSGFINVFKHPRSLLKGVLFMVGIVIIQCVLWYLQIGEFVIYSYQNEGFNFLSPAFIDILFSYKKGLFVYTPILFIALFGLVLLAYEREYYLIFTWVTFFVVLTYFFSSWGTWFYGCSYGLRAYIDFYAVFFLLFALLIDKLVLWLKLLVIMLSLLTVPLNLIQTYQYKEFILHWIDMDKEKYWEVFLKQDERFKGLLWKRKYNLDLFDYVQNVYLGNMNFIPNSEKTIFETNSKNIIQFHKVSIIQVMFDNEFSDENNSRLVLSIRDSINNSIDFYHNPPLIHFAINGLNKFQTGLYNYELPIIKNENEQIITLKIYSEEEGNALKNIKINFLAPH